MKTDYIYDMPAGKEMDEMVAEKVMGWHKGNFVFFTGKTIGKDNKDWLDADGHYMHGVGVDDGYEDEEDFHLLHWHPSESIMWAWEVVEKMQNEFSFVLSSNDPPTDDEHKWYCEFYPKDNPAFIDHEIYAPTAPLAICKVALLIMMGI
jgi:hypothetical protein